jgi:hypothetical protein
MPEPVASPRLETERVSFGAWLGVVLLFIVFGLIVAVLIGISPRGNDYEAKRAKVREEKLKTIRDEAAKDLNSYAWVDKSKGVARIPIDRAMQLTMAELAQKKPEPANPIESPSPAAQAPAMQPSTQPGPSAAAPAPPSSQPPASPSASPVQSSAGTPIPVAGKTPAPSPH